jgi:heme A synthase
MNETERLQRTIRRVGAVLCLVLALIAILLGSIARRIDAPHGGK